MKNVTALVARRVVLSIISVLLYTLVLSWLVKRFPVLGAVFGVLGLVALAASLWRTLRNPTPFRALGGLAASSLLGLAVAAGMSILLGVDRDAQLASDAAATGSPEAGATPSSAGTDATTAPSDPAPTELAGVDDPVDDCASCPPGGDLRSLRVLEDEDGTILEVDVAGPTTVWVWDLSDAGRPARVVVEDSTASLAGRIPDGAAVEGGDDGVRLRLAGQGPWAVTGPGGDRVPDRGHLGRDGVVDVRDRGAAAAQLASALEDVQRAAPDLDPTTADLLASLVARQVGQRTFTVQVQTDAGATEVTFTQRWPELAQQSTTDTGVWVTADQFLICTDQPCQEFDGTGLPLLSAAVVLANPSALVIEPRPAPDGEHCVVVLATPVGGPSVGQGCWRSDGLLTTVERTELGDRLTLVEVTNDIDPAALVPPGEA